MSSEWIPQFGSSHDPDDSASRNVDIGGLLRGVGGVYQSASVFLDASNTDTDLVISVVAYDAAKQRVSWRQIGGTRTNRALDGDGITMREGYRIVVRVTLVDGRHYDRSVFQRIFHH